MTLYVLNRRDVSGSEWTETVRCALGWPFLRLCCRGSSRNYLAAVEDDDVFLLCHLICIGVWERKELSTHRWLITAANYLQGAPASV